MRGIDILWEMENGQECLSGLRVPKAFSFCGQLEQTVNQTNLVALRILASLQSPMRNISHSEDFRFHPKHWLRSMTHDDKHTEHAMIEWVRKLTVDGKDPSRFGQFLPDVKPKAKAVVVWVSTVQDKGRSVPAGGDNDMYRVTNIQHNGSTRDVVSQDGLDPDKTQTKGGDASGNVES